MNGKLKKPRSQPRRTPSGFKEAMLLPLLPRPERASSIYTDLLVALSPALIWAVFHYGIRPLIITAVSAVMTLGLDIAARTVLKRNKAFDLSPAVTGVIIAFCLPPSAPYWLPVFAAAIAVTVRHIFGGTGRNILNCAAVSLVLCNLLFGPTMAAIPKKGQIIDPLALTPGGFKLAPQSALTSVLSGFLPEAESGELFFGVKEGMIGEMSAFLLILGGLYLVIRGITKPLLPAVYLATVGVIVYLRPTLTAASDFVAFNGALYNVLGGSTMLCAVYMASDPVTTPRAPLSSLIAGIAGGAATVFVRYNFSVELSALIGILVINMLTPLLDRLVKTVPFGGKLSKPKTEVAEEKAEEKPKEEASDEE